MRGQFLRWGSFEQRALFFCGVGLYLADMRSVTDRYTALVAEQKITADAAQEALLPELDQLQQAVLTPVRRGLFRKAAPAPKGLYIWGGVGCGKSFLMDLFVDTLSDGVRRVHFHSFMQEVQIALHEARKTATKDALAQVAKDIATGLKLLALDEMQIKDIADAMIVGRLFELLFGHGVAVITTSNRPPKDLYKNGLNRQLFMPFIVLFERALVIHPMQGNTDYRQNRMAGTQVYFTPAGAEARQEIDRIWHDLTGGEEARFHLFVKGRKLPIPRYFNGVGRFAFYDLCGQPLGPADYLAIAEHLRVLVIEDIPQMGRSNFNEAKRFVTLIDTLYEARVRLICSAAAAPEMLYVEGEGTFEFERTASRLREMQSADWAG